jgi:hypothetical protein
VLDLASQTSRYRCSNLSRSPGAISTVQSPQTWYVPAYIPQAVQAIILTACFQYRSTEAPWYPLGHGIVLAYITIGWLSSLAYMLLLKRENNRRDAGDRDEVIGEHNDETKQSELEKRAKNGRFTSVEEARRDKGDLYSGFRYTL